jgi:hypothetical protein
MRHQGGSTSEVEALLKLLDTEEAEVLVSCGVSRVNWKYRRPVARLIEIGPPAVKAIILRYHTPPSLKRISESLYRTHCLEALVGIGTTESFRWLGQIAKIEGVVTFSQIVAFVEAYRTHFVWDVPLSFLDDICEIAARGLRWTRYGAVLFDALCQTECREILEQGSPSEGVAQKMKDWVDMRRSTLRWDSTLAAFGR